MDTLYQTKQSSKETLSTTNRVDLIDSLRAFALLGIVLIHCIEHFNLFYRFKDLPQTIVLINTIIHKTVFFLFAGKAYAIFSFLFGFSFFIQMRNQAQKGYDFRLRFAWRLVLLFLFGQLNALFYPGDILVLYSIAGFVLILVSNWSNKVIFIVAIILLLQPLEWMKFFIAFGDDTYKVPPQLNWQYFRMILPILKNGTFLEVLQSNIWHGQLFSNFWQVENGRLFQSSGLFMLGMLSGRLDLYSKSEKNMKFWGKALIIGILSAVPLYFLNQHIHQVLPFETVKLIKKVTISSITNLALMTVVISTYILLWYNGSIIKLQKAIIPYGRMSLTNYISMGLFGAILYFGYGFSLYDDLSDIYSFLVGTIMFLVQLYFSKWWLKHHKQGPLEFLWKKLTWVRK